MENGMAYDKYGLIDSMIFDLDRLYVSGVGNMKIVIGTIQKLSALKDGLKKEEMSRAPDHDQ